MAKLQALIFDVDGTMADTERDGHRPAFNRAFADNDYTRSQDFSGARLVINHLGEPDQPFTVLAGNAGDKSYLNMALVHRLHNN